MDRRQHRIIRYTFFSRIILLFSLVFSGCFLIKANGKDFKKSLVKSINIDSNNVVTIVLDNTNKSKRIGEIYELKLFYRTSLFNYETNENVITIKKNISDYKEKFYEDCQYRIEVKWFGGHLFLETVFQNGQFTVLNESYINRI